MAVTRYCLTDFETQIDDDQFSLSAADLGPIAGRDDWYVKATSLKGGESQGVKVVELCNGPLRLFVLPTRGMSVWKANFHGTPLEWRSPVRRPVHPHFVNLHDRGGLGWLNGFNELLVRCGLGYQGPPGQDQGQSLTLHGRIGNLPAHHASLEIDAAGPGILRLTGIVDESTMFGPCYRLTSTVELNMGGNIVRFHDEIQNIGGVPAEVSLLYHINIGQPFLDPGARNAVAAQEIVPRDPRSADGIEHHAVYESPTTGFVEQAYFYRPAVDERGWSGAVLHNREQTLGFRVRYDARQLPRFVVWKNTQSLAEGYVTGLEPAVNFPNFRGYERQQQRLPVLPPGGTYETSMTWDLATTAAGVAEQLQEIATLNGGQSPVIHRQPQPGWSPSGESTP